MVSLKTNYIDGVLEDGLTETRWMTRASFSKKCFIANYINDVLEDSA